MRYRSVGCRTVPSSREAFTEPCTRPENASKKGLHLRFKNTHFRFKNTHRVQCSLSGYCGAGHRERERSPSKMNAIDGSERTQNIFLTQRSPRTVEPTIPLGKRAHSHPTWPPAPPIEKSLLYLCWELPPKCWQWAAESCSVWIIANVRERWICLHPSGCSL